MVLVKNPTKCPITVVITHPDAPKTDVAFHQQIHDPKTGDVATRIVDRRLPESVTLLGGEERELPGYAKREALQVGLEVVKRETQEQVQERVPIAKEGEQKPPRGQESQEHAPPERVERMQRGGEQKDAEGLPNALKRKRGAE